MSCCVIAKFAFYFTLYRLRVSSMLGIFLVRFLEIGQIEDFSKLFYVFIIMLEKCNKAGAKWISNFTRYRHNDFCMNNFEKIEY